MAVRPISAEGLRDLFAQHSSSSMFPLVTFYDDDNTVYARVTNNNETIVHYGTEYVSFPFTLKLPSDTEEEVPQLKMTVSNVERSLVDLLRSVVDAPNVTIEVVRVTLQGDVTTELGPLDFSLVGSNMSAESVSLTIGYTNDILNSNATGEIFNPGTAPALFSGA